MSGLRHFPLFNKLAFLRALLIIAAALVPVFGSHKHEVDRCFTEPIDYLQSNGRLYILNKTHNTILCFENIMPNAPPTLANSYKIEPDDADHFYIARKLYQGPIGIVVHSYIYAQKGSEFIGYRFREYADFEKPPRDLLTILPTRPKYYPELRYASDPQGHHWFVHDFPGCRNLWRLNPDASAIVTDQSSALPQGLEALGETNAEYSTWVDLLAGDNGNLYAVSGEHGAIVVYSSNGVRLCEMGNQGFEDYELLAPDALSWILGGNGEQRLAVASTGNRGWVLFDQNGNPAESILPLKSGYPFKDMLVGRIFTNAAGQRMAFDLVNKVLVSLGETCSAQSAYRERQPWLQCSGLICAVVLLVFALFVGRLRGVMRRLRFPVSLKLMFVFLPLIFAAIVIAAALVRDSMKGDLLNEYKLRATALARAIINNLSHEDLMALETPGSRQGQEYKRIYDTISSIVDVNTEQSPKWILHKIIDGHYYFGVNVWRGPIFEPCIVPADRDFFFEALQDKRPHFGRFSDEQGDWHSLLTPITNVAGAVDYVLELYRPAEALDRADLKARKRVVHIAGIAAFIAIVIVLVVAYGFTRPLRRFVEEAKLISCGHFDRPIVQRSRDELGDLALSFNKMGSELEEYMLNFARSTAEKERIQTELNFAREVQFGVLPKKFPPMPGMESVAIAACMEPAREVGGDFFDFFMVDEHHLAVAIADVSGKGVPAGLFLMVVRTLLRTCAERVLSAGKALTEVNRLLSADNPLMMFVTMFYMTLDLRTGRMAFSNAGHNPPALLRNGKVVLIGEKPPGKGVAMGVDETIGYEDGFCDLTNRDTLVFYTDGATECMDAQGRFYGDERLFTTIEAGNEDSNQQLCARILADLRRHQGSAEQADDITLLVLKLISSL